MTCPECDATVELPARPDRRRNRPVLRLWSRTRSRQHSAGRNCNSRHSSKKIGASRCVLASFARVSASRRSCYSARSSVAVSPSSAFDDGELVFDIADRSAPFDVDAGTFDFVRALAVCPQAVRRPGVRCVNRYEVVATCGDKLLTSAALERAGVPQPRTLDGLHAGSRATRDRNAGLSRRDQAGRRLLGPTGVADQRP